MAMVPWRSGSARLAEMERRMQQIFDQPFRFPFGTEEMGWSPSVEVTESNGSIDVTAELPGVAREDVEVNLENNVLSIRGEKKQERKEEEKESYLLERYYGSFQRSFALPAPVDESKVTAEFKDGVLKVHLQKSPQAKGRKIAVNG
jgi:HSP20 family protein